MLLGEQGCRYEDRRLTAVLHRLEDRTYRNLGLAEPDVAAHQAIHGQRPFHVGLDILDGSELVSCLLVEEGLLELALPRGVSGEGVALCGNTLLVQENQFLGRSHRPLSAPLTSPSASRIHPSG